MARLGIFLVAAMMCASTAYAANDGYEGLFAPSHDDTSTLTTKPLAPPVQYTQPSPSAGVIHDLGVASAIYGHPNPALTVPATDFSGTTHAEVGGKPALVYMIEQRIKNTHAILDDNTLSRSERKEKMKQAYQSLAKMDESLQHRQTIPDDRYKSMGFTDTYIQEEKDSNAAALKELDATLDDLKSYQ